MLDTRESLRSARDRPRVLPPSEYKAAPTTYSASSTYIHHPLSPSSTSQLLSLTRTTISCKSFEILELRCWQHDSLHAHDHGLLLRDDDYRRRLKDAFTGRPRLLILRTRFPVIFTDLLRRREDFKALSVTDRLRQCIIRASTPTEIAACLCAVNHTQSNATSQAKSVVFAAHRLRYSRHHQSHKCGLVVSVAKSGFS